jgi:23S rRNA pseudouridine2604 synthase
MPPSPNSADNAAAGVRLSKRVAELAQCSRADAERYIALGWVRVNGQVAQLPQQRVDVGAPDRVEIEARTGESAALADPQTVTLLLHKPPGMELGLGNRGLPLSLDWFSPELRAASDRSGTTPLKAHANGLVCVTPLEDAASGLVVFTKEISVRRKLVDDALQVEHEVIVTVAGEVSPGALSTLRGQRAKVSIAHTRDGSTGLRFAQGGHAPGHINALCESAALRIVAMRRIRIGRLGLGAALPEGQWRYLQGYERF